MSIRLHELQFLYSQYKIIVDIYKHFDGYFLSFFFTYLFGCLRDFFILYIQKWVGILSW